MASITAEPFEALAHADHLVGNDPGFARVLGNSDPSGPDSRAGLGEEVVLSLHRFGDIGDHLFDDALVHVVEQVLSALEVLVEVPGVEVAAALSARTDVLL